MASNCVTSRRNSGVYRCIPQKSGGGTVLETTDPWEMDILSVSMEESFFSEANSSSDGQEIARLLWNHNIDYRVH
jgi:hypothetical protein